MKHETLEDKIIETCRTPVETANSGVSDSGEQRAGRLANLLVATNRATMLGLCGKLQEAGLSYKKFYLLGYLEDSGPVSMGDIAHKLRVTVAAGTGIVDGLEKLKYVSRIPDPNDRRKVLVQVSPRGNLVLGELHEAIQALVAEAMSDETKRSELRSLIEGGI